MPYRVTILTKPLSPFESPAWITPANRTPPTSCDETARVAILYSRKDILPGEEITICYYFRFFTLLPIFSLPGSIAPQPSSMETELSCFKMVMAKIHGVICPSDCSCYDPAILALVREGRKIEPTIAKLTNENKIEEAMTAGKDDRHPSTPQRFMGIHWLHELHPLPYCCSEIGYASQGQGVHSIGCWTAPQDLSVFREADQDVYEQWQQSPHLHRDYLLLG